MAADVAVVIADGNVAVQLVETAAVVAVADVGYVYDAEVRQTVRFVSVARET